MDELNEEMAPSTIEGTRAKFGDDEINTSCGIYLTINSLLDHVTISNSF